MLITHDLKVELVQFAAGRWTAENMRGISKGGTTDHVEGAHHAIACLWSKAYYPGNGMGYQATVAVSTVGTILGHAAGMVAIGSRFPWGALCGAGMRKLVARDRKRERNCARSQLPAVMADRRLKQRGPEGLTLADDMFCKLHNGRDMTAKRRVVR